jgi:hypothetical protein
VLRITDVVMAGRDYPVFEFLCLDRSMFQKAPALKALAPTQTEALFKVTQLVALVVFALLGIFAARRFRNEQLRTA